MGILLPAKPAHILIIDQDHISSLLLTKILSKSGHTTLHAECGASGLKKLQECRFNLILTEWRIPCLTIAELMQSIRNGESGTHNQSVPVVAITADLLGCTAAAAKDVGLHDFLYKPVQISELSNRLGIWLTD